MTGSDTDRWDAWCRDFDEVEREVFSLFHTRWMWRVLISLMENGVPERQYVVVQNYFLRTYVGTVCTAIRREADIDVRTSSLARCLKALIECPHFATRTRYQEIIRERQPDEDLYQRAIALFDVFAPSGGEHIDPAVPEAALRQLADAAAPIRKYTNKVLAHRERRPGDVERVSVTFGEINAALDEVGRITKEFYGLRHPGETLWRVTPTTELQFVSMFEVPWYTDQWRAPDDDNDL